MVSCFQATVTEAHPQGSTPPKGPPLQAGTGPRVPGKGPALDCSPPGPELVFQNMPLPAKRKPSSLPWRAEDRIQLNMETRGPRARAQRPTARRWGPQTGKERLPHPTQRARVGTADRLWGWVGSASNPRIPGPGTTAPGVGVLRCGKRQVQKREASSALSLRPTGRSGVGAVPLGTPRLWKGIQPRGPPAPDTGAWGCVIQLLSPGGTSTPSLKSGRSGHLRA